MYFLARFSTTFLQIYDKITIYYPCRINFGDRPDPYRQNTPETAIREKIFP